MPCPADTLPLGGVLVGGRSRRFGFDKAAARVGGRPMAARAADALRPVSDPVVLLGGDGTLAERLQLPWRPDVRSGHGPLAGLATGLEWASELGREGLLVLACDLPLVTSAVLEALVGAVRGGVDAVVAGTEGPPGVQPLCAWYATGTLDAVEAALERGRHSVRELLGALRVERLAPSDAAGDGGPWDVLLLNVNTPDDLATAVRYATSDEAR